MSVPLDTIATNEKPVLRWQVHLARQQPEKLAIVIAAVAVMAFLARVWFGGGILPALVIAFVVFGALSDFLLPITYTLTLTHVSARTMVGLRIMAWSDVRRCYLDDDGVKLSPLGRQSRLEAYRGVYLRFGNRREEVLDTVKKLRPSDG